MLRKRLLRRVCIQAEAVLEEVQKRLFGTLRDVRVAVVAVDDLVLGFPRQEHRDAELAPVDARHRSSVSVTRLPGAGRQWRRTPQVEVLERGQLCQSCLAVCQRVPCEI